MTQNPAWLSDDDPRSLVGRIERVLRVLDRAQGVSCPDCNAAVCGHEVLFSIASGHEDAPRCLACLAGDIERRPEDARDRLWSFVMSKECLAHGWRLADHREGVPAGAAAPCLWPDGLESAPAPGPDPGAPAGAASEAPEHAVEWDAGDLGCGELVLDLRRRVVAMEAGQVLKLVALDPAAPEDLPAWCGLTGHELVFQRHPEYWIRRRSD